MATIADIKRLASLKPLELIAVPLSVFEQIGDSMSFEEITGIFSQGYHPLDYGNDKLVKGIGSFSLLPVVTCNQRCKGCYDIRSLRHPAVRLKRVINTILASSKRHSNYLFDAIAQQVYRSRTITAVRIHVGGDFHSLEYAEFWAKLARDIKAYKPGLPIYTYTKTVYTDVLKSAGINVVKSRLDDGRFNFGKLETVKAMAKEFKGTICPATMRKVEKHYCGDKCKACMNKENVFFVLH